MIESHWRRLAGMHVQDDGAIAAVWLALDRDTDTVHLYDCAVFRREVLAVIAEGVNARGRWIPVAWEKGAEETANQLLERGCRMIPDPVKDTPAGVEVAAREIWERMRSKRFKVDKRLAEWLDEYAGYFRQEGQVPTSGYPLMTATRITVARLDAAKRPPNSTRGRTAVHYPKIAIV